MTNDKQASPLLEALHNFEDNLEGRKAVISAFMRSRVHVLLDHPWDGKSLPSTETRLLFVSDGDDKEQAMLAVFTSRENAEQTAPAMGEFKYPTEVDAQWALLSVSATSGVRINPNSEPAFKIVPELAQELRKMTEANLARRMANSAHGAKTR